MTLLSITASDQMRNYRELTDEELLELERLYPVTPNRTLAKQFDISVDGLQDYVAHPRGWKKDRKAVLIGNLGGKPLTEKQEAWILRHYRNTKNQDIMEKFGIGESTLHRFAREHGLKKSKHFMKKMQAAATAAAYEVCRDYGIYEESSRRQTQLMAEMRAKGERIPGSFMPGQSNKDRLSPKRFKECLEKSRAKRSESIRKDRIRIHFGLPQKTKMHLTYDGSSAIHRNKSIHRSLFRKYGYIVEYGDNTVYYTSETVRHPKMEQNAPKYGLKVEPWEETTF